MMKGLNKIYLVLCLITFSIFISLVSLSFVSAASNITSPVDGNNYTRTNVLFNVTYTNTSDITNPLNASFYASPNGNATRILVGNTTATGCGINACWVMLNFSLANVPDGNYTINATIFNASGSYSIKDSVNASLKVIFDTTPPLVVANATPQSGYNVSSNYSINISIIDTTLNAFSWVRFNVTTYAGVQVAFLTPNNAASNYWNATLDTSTISDGVYNISIVANDTLNNLNNSVNIINFTVDNSVPTISHTCGEATVDRDEVLTCSCGGSDSVSGIETISYTVNPSTSSTGSFTTPCTVTNYAGLSKSSSVSYNVIQPAGGGSSGGGGSSVSTTKKVEKSIASIEAGAAGIVKNFDKDYGIKEIQIEVNNKAQNVKVTVTKYDGKPAAVSISKTGKVYKYLEITSNNQDKLKKAIVRVQVEKSWVNSNGLDKDKLSVSRFANNQWNELSTKYISDDTTNYYYDVELTSFSYFAIGQSSASIAETNTADTSGNDTTTGEETSETQKSNILTIIIWIVIVVVIVIAIVFVVMKIKSGKKYAKFK
ncbi:MAG TPA: PGF-pre-PGF domain-containing protein [Candidatus Nanoarchaeia archaeon]|nr:PGF-pre-PGF domain-containing protein [Candidatus Nanoarchaeia archaeon]